MTDPHKAAGELRDAMLAHYDRTQDPDDRYRFACEVGDRAEALVKLAADLRARAADELREANDWSLADLASHIEMSRARAQQLVERGRLVARRERQLAAIADDIRLRELTATEAWVINRSDDGWTIDVRYGDETPESWTRTEGIQLTADEMERVLKEGQDR